ncbi:hypothetical protein GALL_185760 [mine drainage metagenome]|uniref:Lipoprotein n=1 Tax=mine drainage metagenome TaxID=410659 RepID=A0A1J5SC95_9ZZZZ
MNRAVFLLTLGFFLTVSGCASQNQRQLKSPPIDRISAEELARIVPAPIAVLSLDDLVKLSKEGATVDQIIEKIKQTNSSYDLSPSQSIELHQQGVDNRVLDYIHASRELAVRNNIADEISRREKIKRDELEKLRRQQWLQQQQRFYDPFCGYGPYGIYPYGYGGYYGRHLGFGAGFSRPWGCW